MVHPKFTMVITLKNSLRSLGTSYSRMSPPLRCAPNMAIHMLQVLFKCSINVVDINQNRAHMSFLSGVDECPRGTNVRGWTLGTATGQPLHPPQQAGLPAGNIQRPNQSPFEQQQGQISRSQARTSSYSQNPFLTETSSYPVEYPVSNNPIPTSRFSAPHQAPAQSPYTAAANPVLSRTMAAMGLPSPEPELQLQKPKSQLLSSYSSSPAAAAPSRGFDRPRSRTPPPRRARSRSPVDIARKKGRPERAPRRKSRSRSRSRHVYVAQICT